MRILHSLFTRGIGGTERHLAELANGQVAAGHHVSVVTRGDRKPGGMTDPFPDWLRPEVNIIPISQRWPLPAMYMLLRRREYKPDIIHSHHGRDGRYLTLAAAGTGIPVIATLHMGYRHRDYRRHDGLICISQWQQEDIPHKMRDASIVIPNWITPPPEVSADARNTLRQQAGITGGEWLIGTVGRLYRQKGMDLLLQAFIEAEMPGCRLCIFGEGEMLNDLQEMIEKSGRKNIRLMGYEENIRPWYNAFDLFVMPSRWEPFGLALIEAMAAGCPVITTRTAGARDIMRDDERVIWAQPDDQKSLTTALEESMPLLGKRFNYPQLQYHGYDNAVQKVLEFYRRFL